MEIITDLANNWLFVNSINPEDKLVYEIVYDENTEDYYINYFDNFKKIDNIDLKNDSIIVMIDNINITLMPINFELISKDKSYVLPSILN